MVDAFDAHAKLYLEGVHTQERISVYLVLLQDVGRKLIPNAETRGPLRPCYDDDHLRQIAASSFEFIAKKACLSAEQEETELQKAVARLRILLKDTDKDALVL